VEEWLRVELRVELRRAARKAAASLSSLFARSLASASPTAMAESGLSGRAV
jgi:hypothetical protein